MFTDRLRAFRQSLKDTGYVEGEKYRRAENRLDRLPELAAELARRKVAVTCRTAQQGSRTTVW
jgi:putative ABC transport system substrate-binding protein